MYEYAYRKSLDRYLDNDNLTWAGRLKICIAAARGLAYLHTPGEIQLRVLHRDIKSSNILLDEKWNAKIADFGLSKFAPANQQFTYLVSNAVGTFGYVDPLYAETGFLTKESHVYSFVVLFEVLCGSSCIDYKKKLPPLIGLARHCYEEKRLYEIIYDNIKDEINPHSLKVFSEIAYQCLKKDPEERLLMAKTIHPVGLNEYDPEGGGLLVVTIHGGDDLNAKQPFVLLRVGPDIRRTTTKKNTRNPVWKETFKFTLNKPENLVMHLAVCSDSKIFRSTPKNVTGNIDIHLANVIKEKHIHTTYHLPNGRIHAKLQWEPSESTVKMKPKLLQFMSSFYNVTVGKGRGRRRWFPGLSGIPLNLSPQL